MPRQSPAALQLTESRWQPIIGSAGSLAIQGFILPGSGLAGMPECCTEFAPAAHGRLGLAAHLKDVSTLTEAHILKSMTLQPCCQQYCDAISGSV